MPSPIDRRQAEHAGGSCGRQFRRAGGRGGGTPRFVLTKPTNHPDAAPTVLGSSRSGFFGFSLSSWLFGGRAEDLLRARVLFHAIRRNAVFVLDWVWPVPTTSIRTIHDPIVLPLPLWVVRDCYRHYGPHNIQLVAKSCCVRPTGKYLHV